MNLEFVGFFKMVKTSPNEPKVIFLLIKTYFSEYLRPERSPAAQRCACLIFLCFETKMMETSITPSCGGPLRAQIFRKVCFYEQKQDFWPIIRKICFYEQKQDFWPIRTRFDPLKGPPKFILFSKKKIKQKIYFIYCHSAPTCQNSVPMVKSLNLIISQVCDSFN